MTHDLANAREVSQQQQTEVLARGDLDINLFNEAYSTPVTTAGKSSDHSTMGGVTSFFTSTKDLLFSLTDTDEGASPTSVQLEKSEAELQINSAQYLDAPLSGQTVKIADADAEKIPGVANQPVDVSKTPLELVKNPPAPKDIPAGRVNVVVGTDSRFIGMTDSDLEKKIGEKSGKLANVEEVREMFKELVRRYDSDLTKEQFATSVPAVKLLLDALKAGKDLDGPDDKRVVGSDDLTQQRRWDFHRAIFADMQCLNNQIQVRQEYAKFLQACGQFKEAESMGIEARDYAERLMKPVDVDGKKVRPIDLIQQEAERLVNDQEIIKDPQRRQEMDKASWILIGTDLDSGALKTPINTNKFLAQLYLGTEIVPKLNGEGKIVGIQDVQFGKSSVFKPEKAIGAADKAMQYTREILKIDPLDAKTAKEKNLGVATMFRVLADVVEKPEKYKLFVGKTGDTFVNDKGETVKLKGGEIVGKNDHDVPILIEAHSVQNLKNQIKKGSDVDSIDSLLKDIVTIPPLTSLKYFQIR